MKTEAKVHYSARKKDQPQEETREVYCHWSTAQKSQTKTVLTLKYILIWPDLTFEDF